MPDVGYNPGFTSNKPTHYLLGYGDSNTAILGIGSKKIFPPLKRN